MENIHTMLENLEIWQIVTVSFFMLLWAMLTIVYVKSNTAQKQSDDSIVDFSVFSKDRLLLFAVAILLMLIVFVVVPFALL